MMRFLSVAISLLLLSACTTSPLLPTVGDPQQAWQERKQVLSAIDHFRISGRMSISRDVEAWHINLVWKQSGDHYDIQLSGPFGAGQVRLSGNGQGPVLLETSEGKFYASSPELLLFEQTGVQMPVSGLRFWLLGLPEPSRQVEARRLDKRGRLSLLQQEHWRVKMKRYKEVGNMELPDKVFASKDDLKVRLVIDEWLLGLS